MTSLEPPGVISDAVARRVQETRRKRGMTAADLAEACAKAGFPQLTASVIANIESGRRDQQGHRRRQVTIDEVYAFSQALGVGVTILLSPPPGWTLSEWQWHDRLEEQRGRVEQLHAERLAELDRLADQEQIVQELDLDEEHRQLLRQRIAHLRDPSELAGDPERIRDELLQVITSQASARAAEQVAAELHKAETRRRRSGG